MTIKEILNKCSELEVSEKRSVSDEYGEIVFYNRDIDEWSKILTGVLGEAIKPTGVKPAFDHLALTKDFGGIYKNQTMFKKDFESCNIMAMFWPWQDNEHTTLKVVLLRKDK